MRRRTLRHSPLKQVGRENAGPAAHRIAPPDRNDDRALPASSFRPRLIQVKAVLFASYYVFLSIWMAAIIMDDVFRRSFGHQPDVLPESQEFGIEPAEPIVFGHQPDVSHAGREQVAAPVEAAAPAEDDEPLHDVDEMTPELRHRVLDPANHQHGILESALAGLARLVGHDGAHPATDADPK